MIFGQTEVEVVEFFQRKRVLWATFFVVKNSILLDIENASYVRIAIDSNTN